MDCSDCVCKEASNYPQDLPVFFRSRGSEDGGRAAKQVSYTKLGLSCIKNWCRNVMSGVRPSLCEYFEIGPQEMALTEKKKHMLT